MTATRRTWGRFVLGMATALAFASAGCQGPGPAATPGAAGAPAVAAGDSSVRFAIRLPKKPMKAGYSLQAESATASAVLPSAIEVSLSGPGFLSSLHPEGFTNGVMKVESGAFQSDSVASQIRFVPTGNNRFIKVVATNGAKKLHVIAGVLDVVAGRNNQVTVGLDATPTGLVVEKLATIAPRVLAEGFSAKALQAFITSQLTRPVTSADPSQPANVYSGYHPYCVNPQGLVDYLRANDFQIPATFDPSRADHRAMVLRSGQVRIVTGTLPAGSRLWVNDPTSPILTVGAADASRTEYVIDSVAPNFEPANPADVPTWTVTVMTPGRIQTAEVSVPRLTLNDPAAGAVTVDLVGRLQDASATAPADITGLFLSPGPGDWVPAVVDIQGRMARQLFAYAVSRDGTKVMLPPDMVTWRRDPADATLIQVGTGASGLADQGLVYPLGETGTGTATVYADLATPGGTRTGSVAFRIANLATDDGRVYISVEGARVYVTPADQTLTAMLAPKTYTVVEDAPAGTTYRWVASHPAIHIENPTEAAARVFATGDLGPTGTATLTVYSTTGRMATATVHTAFGNGQSTATVRGPAPSLSILPIATTNVGNPDGIYFTPDPADPNGRTGSITERNVGIWIGARDSADGAAEFFWRSSDPSYVSVESADADGKFPSARAILKAQRERLDSSGRPVPITITAMNRQGLEIATPIGVMLARGQDGLAVSLPIALNTIALAPGSDVASMRSALNAPFGSATFSGTESVASPAFTWVSLDPNRLQITPPSGQGFPNAQATFTVLREGSASFKLISASTGKERTFTVNLAFSQKLADVTPMIPSLRLGLTDGLNPTLYPSTLRADGTPELPVTGLGRLVTLEVDDPLDPAANFLWSADEDARHVQLVPIPGSRTRMQVRLFDYGPHTIRVANASANRWGVLTLTAQPGSADATIKVTL